VHSAVNALGVNQREHAERLGRVENRLDGVEIQLTSLGSKLDDTNARVRSLEDTTGEIKDLLIKALER
jgi:chromosome segregation ATPase